MTRDSQTVVTLEGYRPPKNIYITEIYMKKQYKSSMIKDHKIEIYI